MSRDNLRRRRRDNDYDSRSDDEERDGSPDRQARFARTQEVRNPVESEMLKSLTKQMGLSLFKKGALEYKANMKPEVYFVGQIVGGFNFQASEGLCCELIIKVGRGWEILSPPRTMQTHTCYAEPGFPYAWAHPLELYFVPRDLSGWPKGIVRVYRLDESNKLDLYSYGVFNFPRTSGFHRIECETWTPLGNWRSTALSIFMGNQPRLNWTDTLLENSNQREFINSQSNGTVILELESVLRNFNSLNIST